jgi:radical SAM protein with 4Fe4S-binding SPASM domain
MVWQAFRDQDVREFRLTPADAVSLDSYKPESDADFLRLHERAAEAFETEPEAREKYLYNCGAAVRSFHIDPYGQLTVCSMTRTPAYDLLSGSFREGWQTLGEWRSVQVSKDFACLHCDLSTSICQRCPAFSVHEHGDPETVVEYACAIAHLRGKRMGLDSRLKERGLEVSGI